MATPAFVPQPSTLSTAIRYHGPLDPYHYTIDNRPLQDIEANLIGFGTGGIDGARRASLIAQLGIARRHQDGLNVDSNAYMEGFTPAYSAGTLSINPGSIFFQDTLFVGSSTVVTKQAIMMAAQTFSMSAPGGVGTSVDYLIQAEIKYFATGVSSPTPYFDPANPYIASSVLGAELVLTMKTGAAAATNSQVTPSTDVGKTAMFAVTFTYGAGNPIIRLATGAPNVVRMNRTVDLLTSAINPAQQVEMNGMSIARFNDGVTQSVALAIPLDMSVISPYAPLRVKFAYRASATGNYLLEYESNTLTSGTAAPATSVYQETLTPLGVTNIYYNTASTYSYDNSNFCSFNGGVWGVSGFLWCLKLSRKGADGSDTSTGALDIVSIKVYQ